MSAHTFARLRRIVHFFGIGVLDQVLLSGASFVAGFVMIRFTNDVAYGQFVLAQSAILLALSAQGAWLSGPANAIAPKKTPEDRRLMIGSLAASQTRLLRRVTPALLLVPLAGYLVGLSNAIDAIVIATTILACWVALERQYLRTVLLIYSRPAWMLRTDIFYIIVWLAGIGFAVLNSHAAGAWAVGSLIAAGWVGAISARRMLAVDPGWIAGNARPFWQELRPLGL